MKNRKKIILTRVIVLLGFSLIAVSCSLSGQNEGFINDDGTGLGKPGIMSIIPAPYILEITNSTFLPGNLLPDPSFEGSPWVTIDGNSSWLVGWWPLRAGILRLQGLHIKSGGYGIYMYTMSQTNCYSFASLSTKNSIPVQGGRRLIATIWYRSASPSTLRDGYYSIILTAYGANGNVYTYESRMTPAQYAASAWLWQPIFLETPVLPADVNQVMLDYRITREDSPTVDQLTMTVDDATLHSIGSSDYNPVRGAFGEPTIYETNQAGGYTCGVVFTPKVNATITKLGGCFDGTATVYLSAVGVAPNLSAVQITPRNAWTYERIVPVKVTAGRQYSIQVTLPAGAAVRRQYPYVPPFNPYVTLNYFYTNNLARTTSALGWVDVSLSPDQ